LPPAPRARLTVTRRSRTQRTSSSGLPYAREGGITFRFLRSKAGRTVTPTRLNSKTFPSNVGFFLTTSGASAIVTVMNDSSCARGRRRFGRFFMPGAGRPPLAPERKANVPHHSIFPCRPAIRTPLHGVRGPESIRTEAPRHGRSQDPPKQLI